MVTGSMAKHQRDSTFFAKYDNFSLIYNSIQLNNLPKIASVNSFRSYVLTYSSTNP